MSTAKVKIIKLSVVSSTNDYLKNLAREGADSNTIVIADKQTGGKGTKNRSFISEKGGVYLSILVKPDKTGFDVTLITPMTAVAVSDTIEQISGVKADIKWVNDVYIADKKAAGILCESVIMPNGVMPYIIVGIGVNLFLPQGGFSDPIKDIATNVFEDYDEDKKQLFIKLLIENFYKYYDNLDKKTFFEKYINRSCVVGKNILVSTGDGWVKAYAKNIDEKCRLVVRYDDETTKTLSSGEVSIKI